MFNSDIQASLINRVLENIDLNTVFFEMQECRLTNLWNKGTKPTIYNTHPFLQILMHNSFNSKPSTPKLVECLKIALLRTFFMLGTFQRVSFLPSLFFILCTENKSYLLLFTCTELGNAGLMEYGSR